MNQLLCTFLPCDHREVPSLDLDILGLLEHSGRSDQPHLVGGKNFICPALDNRTDTIACQCEAVPLPTMLCISKLQTKPPQDQSSAYKIGQFPSSICERGSEVIGLWLDCGIEWAIGVLFVIFQLQSHLF